MNNELVQFHWKVCVDLFFGSQLGVLHSQGCYLPPLHEYVVPELLLVLLHQKPLSNMDGVVESSLGLGQTSTWVPRRHLDATLLASQGSRNLEAAQGSSIQEQGMGSLTPPMGLNLKKP